MYLVINDETDLLLFVSLSVLFFSVFFPWVYYQVEGEISIKLWLPLLIIGVSSLIGTFYFGNKHSNKKSVTTELLETTAKDLFERNYKKKAEYIEHSRTRITIIDYHGNKYILPVERKGYQMIIDTTFIELPNKSDKIRTIINNISI